MTLATVTTPVVGSPVPHTRAGNTAIRLLLAHEAAALLRIPANRVYELAKRGVIPCVHIGRLVRFPECGLMDWIAAGGSVDEALSSFARDLVRGGRPDR